MSFYESDMAFGKWQLPRRGEGGQIKIESFILIVLS